MTITGVRDGCGFPLDARAATFCLLVDASVSTGVRGLAGGIGTLSATARLTTAGAARRGGRGKLGSLGSPDLIACAKVVGSRRPRAT